MRRLSVLVVAVLIGACASESRILRDQPTPLAEFPAERRVTESWSASTGAGAANEVVRLAPYLDGDTVFAADYRGRVTAIRASDGRELWSRALGVTVTAAPGAGDGLVLVGTGKGELIALDKGSGEQRWATTVPGGIRGRPAAQAGMAVVQTIDGKLYGLASADGKRQWVYGRSEPALTLLGTSSPVIAGSYVFTGFASGRIVALRLADGRLLWDHAVAEPRGRNEIERLVDVDAPVLLVGDHLFAGAFQGRLVAVDLRSGRISWSRDVSAHVPLAADRRNVYVADEHGMVMAFDQRSGASVWKQDRLRGRQLSGPAHVDAFVAVGDLEGYVHWLSADDGHFVARHRIGSAAIAAAPAAGPETLYFANQDGDLAALRLVRP